MSMHRWSAGLLLACALSAVRAAEPLAYFSERPENSGATTFNIGDRFNGPGVVTIGWLGSKKQVVLPAGLWVTLAAVDHDSGGTRPVKMATVLFGRFAGNRLATMLSVMVNRHATAAHWIDVEACAQDRAGRLWHVTTPPSALRVECAEMVVEPRPLPVAGRPLGDEFRATMKRLGAQVRGPAIVTRFYFDEKRSGHMRIVRSDWPDAALGRIDAAEWQPGTLPQLPARAAYVQALIDGAQVYRPMAREGFLKDLDLDDLGAVSEPASRVPGPVAPLGAIKDY